MRKPKSEIRNPKWRSALRSVLDWGSPLPLWLAGLLLQLATGASAETFLLKGATIHRVSAEPIPAGEVLIRDGKIAAVGKSVGVTNVPVVDLSGLHLFPGMIALDTALGLTEIGGVRVTVDTREVGEFTPDVQSWIAVNPDSELLPVARANGVAHFEPAPQGGVVAGQSGLVALEGWTSDEMTVKKPLALHVYWPPLGLDSTPREQLREKTNWKSLEEQAKNRAARLRALDDFFKEAQAYARARDAATKGQATTPTPDPSWEAMLPYVRGERPLTIHADDANQIRSCVAWAATNNWKIILAGGREAWQVAGLLATNRVPVVYEHVFTRPARDTDAYDTQFRAPAILQKAGVKVAFALRGEFSASLTKNLPYEAAQAVAFGLPADEALRGLTLYPAQFCGVADRLGSIEPGKEATVFVMDGDILDIRANVKRMWIAGKEVGLESRHTRLYEKYRNRPKLK